MEDVHSRPGIGRIHLIWKTSLVLALLLLIIGWLNDTPPGLLGKADALGYAVCHRLDGRTFHIGERQLPLCARCSGMYLGAVLGLAFQNVVGKRKSGAPPRSVAVVLGLFFLAFAVDGSNSFLSLIIGRGLLYEPSNMLRLFTGTGMGLVIAAVLYPVFLQTVWADTQPQAALKNLGFMSILIGVGLLSCLLILTENAAVLFALAILGSAGVLLLLTMIYTVMLVILFRQDNHYEHLRQLWPALAGGLLAALSQVYLIDIVRFYFTQTWGGFPLG